MSTCSCQGNLQGISLTHLTILLTYNIYNPHTFSVFGNGPMGIPDSLTWPTHKKQFPPQKNSNIYPFLARRKTVLYFSKKKNFPNENNFSKLPEKTKNFWYLSEKLILCTFAKKSKPSILDLFWRRLWEILPKFNRVYNKLIRMLVCTRI